MIEKDTQKIFRTGSILGLTLLISIVIFFGLTSQFAEASNLDSPHYLSGLMDTNPASLTLPVQSAQPGQTISINLTINTSVPSRGAQFDISFDPTILSCTSITQGSFYSTWANANGASILLMPTPSCNNSTGTISTMGISIMGGSSNSGPSGTGIVATLNFTVLANAHGISPLNIVNGHVFDASGNGLDVGLTVNNGMVMVGVTPTFTSTSVNLNTLTATITPSLTPSLTRTFTLTATSTPTMTATSIPGLNCSRCDVSGDGVINAEDVVLVGVYWLETGTPGWITEDVNMDGVVNTGDVVAIGRCFGQPPICVDCGSPTVTQTPNITTQTSTQTVTQTGTQIVTSTTTSTGTPTPTLNAYTVTNTSSSTPTGTITATSPTTTLTPTGSVSPATSSTSTGTNYPTLTFTPTSTPAASFSAVGPTASVAAGTDFDVQITINSTASTRGSQFKLSFNPAVLTCDSVDEGTFYSDWATANGGSTLIYPSPSCDNQNGVLTLMGISIMGGADGGPSGAGLVATVHFTTLVNGTSPLTLSEVVVNSATNPVRDLGAYITNGQVTVSSSGASTVTPTSSQTVTKTITPTRTITLTPTISPTSTITQTPTSTHESTDTVAPSLTYVATQRPTIASSSRLGFNPAQVEVTGINQTFTINVVLSVDKASRGAEVTLSFNPNFLSCSKVEQGNFYKSWAASNGASAIMVAGSGINNTTGTIGLYSVALMGGNSTAVHEGGPTGNGSLLVITCKSKAIGSSVISFSHFRLFDDNVKNTDTLACSADNGQIYIGVTPTPTPYGQSGPTAVPTIPVDYTSGPTGTPGPTATPQTDINGNTLTPTPETTVDTSATIAENGNGTANPEGTVEATESSTVEPTQLEFGDKVDSNGILQENVTLQVPDQPWEIDLGKGVQALDPNTLPLHAIQIQSAGQTSSVAPNQLTIIGSIIDLGPAGSTFDPPIKIVFHYDKIHLPKGVSESSLAIYSYDPTNKKWVAVKSQIDLKAKTVTANLSHFSSYALLGRPTETNWILIGVASIIVEVCIGLGVIYYLNWRRRKKSMTAGEGEPIPGKISINGIGTFISKKFIPIRNTLSGFIHKNIHKNH